MKGFFLVRSLAGLLVWAVMVITGCTKHKPADAANGSVPPAVSAEPDTGTANSAAVRPKVAPMTLAPAGADPAPMLAQMTMVLRKFAVEHRQVPKSLNDLVAAGYLTALPPAPAGKQFAIESKHLEVILESH